MPFNFDPTQFVTASVSGIPIVVPILLLVYSLKRAGVAGKALFFSSLGVGTAFGVAYQVATTGVPTSFSGYFAYGVYGMTLGLGTSYLNDYLKEDVAGAIRKVFKLPADPASYPTEDQKIN